LRILIYFFVFFGQVDKSKLLSHTLLHFANGGGLNVEFCFTRENRLSFFLVIFLKHEHYQGRPLMVSGSTWNFALRGRTGTKKKI